jgi:DNA-binding beta-propeller fold protein YncE
VAEFNNPAGVAVDTADNVYVTDKNNHRVRKITSVGIRQLAVTWSAPSSASAITGYVASASAVSQVTQTCTTTTATSCTIDGLTRGVVSASPSPRRTPPARAWRQPPSRPPRTESTSLIEHRIAAPSPTAGDRA